MTKTPERVAYDSFRNGCCVSLPQWQELPDWIRDAMKVAYLQGILDAEPNTRAPSTVGVEASQHQRMRNAIDAVELALNGLEIDDVVRRFEGAADTVMVKLPLGALRQLGNCYPELNRIINDPAFESPTLASETDTDIDALTGSADDQGRFAIASEKEGRKSESTCICDQDHPTFKERGHHPHCPASLIAKGRG